MNISGQRVLIIGGATGIGLAVARQAKQAGAEVIIASRHQAVLDNAITQLGNGVVGGQLDVTDESSVQTFFDAIDLFDHLVFTVKPPLPVGVFVDSDLDQAQQAFDTKFWGQCRVIKHAVSRMSSTGTITLTSGVASRRAFKGYAVVSAINAATEALIKSLAVELTPIRVNVICPGFVASAAHPRQPGQIPSMPLQREAQAAEIAGAYLQAMDNTYMTGTVLVVDGGVSC